MFYLNPPQISKDRDHVEYFTRNYSRVKYLESCTTFEAPLIGAAVLNNNVQDPILFCITEINTKDINKWKIFIVQGNYFFTYQNSTIPFQLILNLRCNILFLVKDFNDEFDWFPFSSVNPFNMLGYTVFGDRLQFNDMKSVNKFMKKNQLPSCISSNFFPEVVTTYKPNQKPWFSIPPTDVFISDSESDDGNDDVSDDYDDAMNAIEEHIPLDTSYTDFTFDLVKQNLNTISLTRYFLSIMSNFMDDKDSIGFFKLKSIDHHLMYNDNCIYRCTFEEAPRNKIWVSKRNFDMIIQTFGHHKIIKKYSSVISVAHKKLNISRKEIASDIQLATDEFNTLQKKLASRKKENVKAELEMILQNIMEDIECEAFRRSELMQDPKEFDTIYKSLLSQSEEYMNIKNKLVNLKKI